MKQRMMILLGAIGLIMVSTALACAQPLKTFVSSTGNDANDCRQATPCRTFAGAVPKTSAKGWITALDSGSYGSVTIDKALTIQAAPGVTAIIEGGKAADAVTINAPGSVVVLRNLEIVTTTLASTKGIVMNSVGTLHVEGCLISGFKSAGVSVLLACDAGGCSKLFVNDSTFRENSGGLRLASVEASIDHCRIENNTTGVEANAQSKITIRDTIVAGNSDVGLDGPPLGGARIENCMVTNNGTGIRAANQSGAESIFLVSNTTIMGNNVGLAPNGGQIISFENNRLAVNATNGAFTSTLQQH